LDVLAPSAAGDTRVRRWLARSERLVCSVGEAAWRFPRTFEIDLRAGLGPGADARGVAPGQPQRRAGPLRSRARPGGEGHRVAAGDALFFIGPTGPLLDAIEEFLTGRLPTHHSDRVPATVLFTDIVGSTEHAARLGGRRWRDLLAAHDALVRAEVLRFRGRLVKSTGYGVLATFDGPGRAIRCACVVRDSVSSLGINLRAGLHTGEVEVLADDIAGVAVHIGARVSGAAGAGELLVSSTVRDLVAGSGIQFEDRGEHELRGVPGSWRLYSAAM
jgi:class 3 adenylate cyclase